MTIYDLAGSNRHEELLMQYIQSAIYSVSMVPKYALSARKRKAEYNICMFLCVSVISLALLVFRTLQLKEDILISKTPRQSNLSLHLIIFTCCRYYSFIRLFRSIENSLPTSIPVKLTIFLDAPLDGTRALGSNDWKHLMQVLCRIRSKHGPVSIERHEKHVGLKNNVLLSWVPQSVSEYAIFLEDDIEVSPLFLYLSSIYITKLHPLPPHIMGISLFNDRVNQLTGKTLQAPHSVAHRLYQQAQSWGAVMSPRQWIEFTQFTAGLGDGFDPNITEIGYGSNNWDKNSSWKKFLLYYMFYSEKYMVYPTFPENKSITTHHVEPSEHFPVRPSYKRLQNELRPKLLELSDLPTMTAMCKNLDWRDMPIFDMSHNMVSISKASH